MRLHGAVVTPCFRTVCQERGADGQSSRVLPPRDAPNRLVKLRTPRGGEPTPVISTWSDRLFRASREGLS